MNAPEEKSEAIEGQPIEQKRRGASIRILSGEQPTAAPRQHTDRPVITRVGLPSMS